MGGARLPSAQQYNSRSMLYKTMFLAPSHTIQEPSLHVLGPVFTINTSIIIEGMDTAIQVALHEGHIATHHMVLIVTYRSSRPLLTSYSNDRTTWTITCQCVRCPIVRECDGGCDSVMEGVIV